MNKTSITLFEPFEKPFRLQNLGTWNLCTGTILSNVHRSLIEHDNQESYSKIGELSSESNKEIRIKIYENSYFSNNQKLKKSDIIWSIERAIRLKALRYNVLKNNLIDVSIIGDSILFKVLDHKCSILDELSAIAYSIFPENSLSDDNYIPIETPGLGAYSIISTTNNHIELRTQRDDCLIKKIDILPSSILRDAKDIFSNHPKAILRTTKSYMDFLRDNSLTFQETGKLYQYLIPNVSSKYLDENIKVLSLLHKRLDHGALCPSINKNKNVKLQGISSLDPYDSSNTSESNEQFLCGKFLNINKFIPERTILKIFGGYAQPGKEIILDALSDVFKPHSVKFCYTDIKNEADFLLIGHMFNRYFPLKSLPYFFEELLLHSARHENIAKMNNFFNNFIIPNQSKPDQSKEIRLFNEYNSKNSLLLPLFIDRIGYTSKRDLNIKLSEPKLIQDWSQVSI